METRSGSAGAVIRIVCVLWCGTAIALGGCSGQGRAVGGDTGEGAETGGDGGADVLDGGSGTDAADADAACRSYPASGGGSTAVAGLLFEPPTVDGELEEAAYGRLPAVSFTDADGESDEEVTLQVGWTDQKLYLAVHVTDADVSFDSDIPLHQNDGLEFFFDTDHDRGSNFAADDRHWIVPVRGEPLTERGSSGDDEPDTDTALEVEAVEHEDSYTMELAAPLSDLDLDLAEGDRLGMLVALNDRPSRSHVTFSWPHSTQYKTPDTWGELLFRSPDCGGAGDVGGDTGPSGGDADAESEGCPADADYEPTPVSGPENIGGGPEYGRKVCRDDAETTVSTLGELESALSAASSGDVIFVDPDAEIDMGFDASLDVPSGVTVAGGRGCDCRAGALLYTDAVVKDDYDHETILDARGSSRVTGLRIRGPRDDRDWITSGEMDHYLDGSGVDAEGSDVEIDNNEIYGFAHAGINGGAGTHVHHNFLHTMPRDGLGYGVSGGDEILIEYNYFEFLRHAVASGGERSYTARYNHMGTQAISHIYDMHKPGGGTIEIHHNTVEAVDNQLKNKNVPAVTIRGTPTDVADIHHNWFYNPKTPRSEPANSWTDEAIVQMHVTEWTNVTFSDNHYGDSDPNDCNIGAPRDGC